MGNGLRITFVMLAQPPKPNSSGLAAVDACRSGELLACAFATWLPQINPASSNAAVLLDCGAERNDAPGVPASWTAALTATATVRCLWGGVCERFMNDTRFSLQCSRGTINLLQWLHDDFSATDYFVKVDTDAMLRPLAVEAYVHSLALEAAAAQLDAKRTVVYAGNNLHTWLFQHCEGVRVKGKSSCSDHGRPCGKLVCLRSTEQWKQLEQTIRPKPPVSLLGMSDASFGGSAGSAAAGSAAAAAFGAEHLRASNRSRIAVGYAQGGTYVLSRGAISAMVRQECVQRVGRVPCAGWSRLDPTGCEHSPRHEDAAVGLCAHLLGGLHRIEQRCFVRYVKEAHFCHGELLALHPLKVPSLYLREWAAHGKVRDTAGDAAAHQGKGTVQVAHRH